MERIYVDGSKNKKSGFKQFFNKKGSTAVVIVVALVAVVSLLAFGFSRISYALPEVNTLPESFVSAQVTNDDVAIGQTLSGKTVMNHREAYTEVNGEKITVFCIEKDITYDAGQTYTRGKYINNQGLIYLMSQLYPNKKFQKDNVDLPRNFQVWLTQAAIWTYLYETGAPNNSSFGEIVNDVKDVNALYGADGNLVHANAKDLNVTYYDLYIKDLVATAKTYNGKTILSVSKKSDTISITNDNKYYQTDLISVVGTVDNELVQNFLGYSVKLGNAPEGTILVDEKGNKYDNLDNMSPTSKFYVRIPVDKVSDKSKDITISIDGNFEKYVGYEYESGEYQKITDVRIKNDVISRPLNFKLDYTPEVPDTGMNTAQTIYFIGLIVLLSGVGIIYANAKPEGMR